MNGQQQGISRQELSVGLNQEIDDKVNKDGSKVLSDNNFTTLLKTAYDNVVTWVSTNGTALVGHLTNTLNPHNVTKTQVGLGNVDNTSDANKPVSTAQVTAIGLKVDKVTGKSLISDTEITRLAGVANFDSTAINAAITALNSGKLDKSTYSGTAQDLYSLIINATTGVTGKSVVPTDTPTGTGVASWIAVQNGTYTNFGGMVLPVNSVGVISRSATNVYSISYTSFDFSTYASKEDLITTIDSTGSYIANMYYSTTGSVLAYNNLQVTAKKELINGYELWVNNIWGSGLTGARNVFFDKNGVFLSSFGNTGGILKKIDIPTGAFFVGLTGTVGTTTQLLFKASLKKQIELINASINVELEDVTGALIIDKYYNINGVVDSYNGVKITGLIPLTRGSELWMKTYWNANLAGMRNVFFDAGGYPISMFSHSNDVLTKIEVPIGASYVGASSETINEIQIKTASTIEAVFSEFEKQPYVNSKMFDLGSDFENTKVDIFNDNYGIFLAGQSNMTSLIPYSELTALSIPNTSVRTKVWNGTSYENLGVSNGSNWGIWWSILRRLDSYLTKTIYSYRNAVGGTTLYSNWTAGTSSSTNLANISALQIGNTKRYNSLINYKCIVWIQGESDNGAPNNLAYQKNLKEFIEFNRGVIGNKTLPFIVVGMHPNQSMYNQVVRDAQLAVCNADANSFFINPDSLTFTSIGDNLHYNGVYAEALGSIIFEQIKNF